MKLLSFSYRDHIIPGADLVIDARELPNPWRVPALRNLNGMDERVADYALADKVQVAHLLAPALSMEESSVIAIGCHGGKHRSVALLEMLARIATQNGISVTVDHMQLGITHRGR